MDKQNLQEVTLRVNHCVIKLANGNVINTQSYRSTNQGIYVLTKNTANLFNLNDETKNDEQKLCFIPYDQIEVVAYDVQKDAPKEDTAEEDEDPQTPQG